MDRIELEVEYMPGTPQNVDVFRLAEYDSNKYQIWRCQKNAPGSKAYHIITYFPTPKNQHATFEFYHKNKKWFDYDEAIMNMATVKGIVQDDDKIHALNLFIESPAYKLVDQDCYIENGIVFAEDRGTGIVRQLVDISVMAKNKSGPSTFLFHFYTFSRSENWNWAMVANLIASQSRPLPGEDLKDRWLWEMRQNQKDVEIVVDDVYVYDGRGLGED